MCKLDDFIEKHSLLSEDQYGFRAKRSTSVAVVKLIEEISMMIMNILWGCF